MNRSEISSFILSLKQYDQILDPTFDPQNFQLRNLFRDLDLEIVKHR